MKLKAEGGIIKAPTLADGWYNVTKYVKQRSSQQNRLLHYMFKEASRGLSNKLGRAVSAEFTKELLKIRFLSRFHEELGDYSIPTSKLTSKQCVEFIENCLRYIAEKCSYCIELESDWVRSIMEE